MSESGQDCKIFHVGKIHKRGPYLDDNCLQDDVIKKTIVSIEQFQGKVKNVTSGQFSAS